MRRKSISCFLLVVLLASASASFAQGSSNRGRLPNGKPFQSLQRAITDVDAALQQQVSSLQAQIDANGANSALLAQMVGSLQVAVSQLEGRMLNAELSLQALQAYITAVDASLQFQVQRIDVLQQGVAASNNRIDQLFTLHNAQQTAINTLQGAINTINFQITQLTNMTNTQAGQITTLQGQVTTLNGSLATLNTQYQTTRALLSSGCPVDSSIRQIGFGGPVVCQPDNQAGTPQAVQFTVQFQVFANTSMSGEVFCPSATPEYIVTGGAFDVFGSGMQIIASQPRGNNGWWIYVRNPYDVPIPSWVTVICFRLQ
jgi:peptidoglycan hydrolase CwlO-like protein